AGRAAGIAGSGGRVGRGGAGGARSSRGGGRGGAGGRGGGGGGGGGGGQGGRGGQGGHAGLALSAHGRITPDSVAGYAFGVRASLREGSRWPARLLLRLDTDGSLRRAGFALGLSLGGNDLVGAVVTFPGDVSRPDAA